MDGIRDTKRSVAVPQQFLQCRVGENGGIFRMQRRNSEDINSWKQCMDIRSLGQGQKMGNTVLHEINDAS